MNLLPLTCLTTQLPIRSSLGSPLGSPPSGKLLFGRQGPISPNSNFHPIFFSGTLDLTTTHLQKETFPTVTQISIQASGAVLPQPPCPPREPPPPPPLPHHLLSPSTPPLPIPPQLPDQPHHHPPTTPWSDQRPPHQTTQHPPQHGAQQRHTCPPRCGAARLTTASTTSTTTRLTTSHTGRTGRPISEKAFIEGLRSK